MSILPNSDLTTKINNEYANNTNEAIKPLTHRTVHGDMNDSKINVQFGNYFRGPVLSTGTANVYAVTLTNQYPTVYTQNIPVLVKINITNTGASTLNVNGLGALAWKTSAGGALAAGQLEANKFYFVNYDGTDFELMDVTSIPGAGFLEIINNLSDLENAGTSRTNLGLGSSAVAALIDDDTFATATAANIPSAESVKAYVDTSAVGVVFEGEELGTTATTFTFIATGVTTAPGDIYNIETTCFVDASNIRFDRVTTMIISATGAQNDSYSVIARGSTATYGISPSTDSGVLNLDFVSMTTSSKNLKVKVTKLFAG